MNQAEVKRRQIGELSNILALITILVVGRTVGNNGITYVIVAIIIYALLWSLICSNLSDTLGRLLRGRRNKGEYKNVAQMRKSAMLFQAALGLVGSLFLLIFGKSVAEGIFGIEYSGIIIRILSPVILLQSVSSVLLGFFQGEGSEVPTAVSRLLRQVFILGFGILFSGMMGKYGVKVSGLLRQGNFTAMYSGMGFAIGVNLAEALVVIFLVLIYKVSHLSAKKARQDVLSSTDSVLDCIRFLCNSRWPQLATGFLMILSFGFGAVLFCKAAEDRTAAILEYGGYTGSYLVICGIVVALISVVTLPVIAKVFVCMKREEARFARAAFQSGVHIGLVHAIFASMFISVMRTQFVGVLWPENGETVQKMLSGGSFVIIFTTLSCYFVRFLQSTGKKYLMLAAVGIADVVFGITTAIMLKIGILSLVYGGMIGMFALCVLLGALSYRQMRMQVDWFGVLIVPLGAGVVSGVVCSLLGKFLSPHIGDFVTLLVSFVVGGAVYWILLLLLRNFKEQELDIIVGGHLINVLGQMLHIY